MGEIPRQPSSNVPYVASVHLSKDGQVSSYTEAPADRGQIGAPSGGGAQNYSSTVRRNDPAQAPGISLSRRHSHVIANSLTATGRVRQPGQKQACYCT